MRRDTSVAVEDLLDGEASRLEIELLSDWGGLERRILRPRIQKPGLALSGFVKHIYNDRVQVFGLTEIDYIVSSEIDLVRQGLETYCARELCCMVLTRGLEPPELLMEVARDHGIPVMRTPLLTSTFISRVTHHLEDLLSPRASIHGVLVDVLGVGLLIIGRSGVGKSEAALDLVLKGHRLVADDVVQVVVRPPDTVWGAATELHQHHMEIRGMGILNITNLFGVAAVRDNKKIEVVVELSDWHDDEYDRLGIDSNVWPILGVDIPLVRVPLRPGRNIASLIEVIARNQLLKVRGHDSAREFAEKVAARLVPEPHAPGVPATIADASSQPVSRDEVE
ncbi:MAG: HPr(Ser) kinase/phosphatase [Myxococcales bacterium FL481]|nr:MAG: HPr(Ser) kinase/phosphatase [Myxococcales bacterium FL481]